MAATPTPANAERLLKLRQAVADAPLEQFDMTYWSCGTSACAAGWYVRANPGCGLRIVGHGGFAEMRTVDLEPGEQASYVLAEHFGIDQRSSLRLFLGWDADDDDPAAQKAEFLAKLDALLAARGIAAPAEGATT